MWNFPVEREVKHIDILIPETHYESFGRSNRSKILTAKDGRGKILIGD